MSATMNDTSVWLQELRDKHRARAAQILSSAKSEQSVFYVWANNAFHLSYDDWDIRHHVWPTVVNGVD